MIQLRPIEPTELDNYVAKKHPEANFLQTSSWGRVYEIDGEKVYYLGLYDGDELHGTAVVIVKNAKRGRYLEIPGGPILDWSHEPHFVKEFMNQIREVAKTENCVFVRMRPNISDTGEHRKIIKDCGLVPSPMHLHAEHTVMIDLRYSEDELLKDMRRQTRYEVRRAEKMGVKVAFDTSKHAFSEFYDLQLETAKRQGFIPSTREFIMAQHDAFGGAARIYTATLDGKPLAKGLVIMQSPEAIYHEAASTEEGRKIPGAYALQWQVIRDARNLGFKRYNLFGIAPPNSPHHRYAGVTTFKTGFGGNQVTYLPAHDLVVRKLRYKFVHMLEVARKKRRHL
jgi:lipid II:glycine glycyltransferase (peptidoglycan interpeptide bridge formation enzyme)